MDDEILRVLITLILVIPMAYTDLKGRQAHMDLTAIAFAIALCFFAYDMFTGALFAMPWFTFASYVFGIFLACSMGILAKIGVFGTGDAVIAAVLVLMNPHDFPVAAASVGIGYIGTVLCVMGFSFSRNMSDMIHGRGHTGSILFSYFKRRGEKFCVLFDEQMRVGGVKTEEVVDEDGRTVERDELVKKDGDSLFVPEDEYGMEVTKTFPMALSFLAMFVVFSSLSILGAFSGVEHHIVDIYMELKDHVADMYTGIGF